MVGFFASSGPLTLTTPRRREPGLLPKCGACKLCEQSRDPKFPLNPKMPVWGKGRRGVLVCGEAPSREEDEQNQPFVGKDGRLLRKCLNQIGVDLDRDCWTVNAIRCRPSKHRAPTANEIEHCRPLLVNAIREHQPETIVLLGDAAVSSLLGWLWAEEPGGIGRWTGCRIPSQKLNTWVCPMWHPSHVKNNEGKRDYGLMERTLTEHLSVAFALKGRPWNPVPDYRKRVRIIMDPEEAAGAIDYMLSDFQGPIAWDIETDRIKPDHPDSLIWSCSMCAGGESISYPWHGAAKKRTLEFLRSDVPKIGFNARFESRWVMAKHGFMVRKWVWDGMLAAHVLDNRAKTKGLGFQAFAKLGFDAWDGGVSAYLKSKGGGGNTPNRIRDCPLPELLTYNALDSLLEYELAMVQAKELGVDLKGG